MANAFMVGTFLLVLFILIAPVEPFVEYQTSMACAPLGLDVTNISDREVLSFMVNGLERYPAQVDPVCNDDEYPVSVTSVYAVIGKMWGKPSYETVSPAGQFHPSVALRSALSPIRM